MRGRGQDIGEAIWLICSEKLQGSRGRKSPSRKVHFLEKILKEIDAIILIYDLENDKQVWTNGNYARLLGYEHEELFSMSLEELFPLFHPDDVRIILEGIESLRTQKGRSFASVYRMRHKEGHWVWIFYQASLFHLDGDTSPRYVLGLAVDFSRQILSEHHLNDLIAENRRLHNEIRLNCLTAREKEIIGFKADGLTCKEISHRLGISYFTAETHIRNIHRKLGLTNLSAVVNFAVESGLKH